MKYKILITTFFIFLFNLSALTLALSVSPFITYAGELELGNNYNFKVLIINEENERQTIQLYISPSTSYLKNYVELPSTIILNPHEKREINIRLSLPRTGLNPGEHSIIILPDIIKSGSGFVLEAVTAIEIRFSIPGTTNKRLELKDFNATNISENVFIFELSIQNTGNTRAEDVLPFIDIERYGITVDSVRGHTHYKLNPSDSSLLKVRYTSSLEAGTYKAVGFIIYDGIKSNIKTDYFTIIPIKQQSNNENESINNSGGVGSRITIEEPEIVDMVTSVTSTTNTLDDVGVSTDKSAETIKTSESELGGKGTTPTGLAISNLTKKTNILIIFLIIIALIIYSRI